MMLLFFAYSAVSIIISRISWCLGINEGALHAIDTLYEYFIVRGKKGLLLLSILLFWIYQIMLCQSWLKEFSPRNTTSILQIQLKNNQDIWNLQVSKCTPNNFFFRPNFSRQVSRPRERLTLNVNYFNS